MDPDVFMELVQKTLVIILELSMPVLMISLIVGLVISLIQAVTQIQEATLTFVPKIIVCLISLMFLGHWMLNTFIEFVQELYLNLGIYVK